MKNKTQYISLIVVLVVSVAALIIGICAGRKQSRTHSSTDNLSASVSDSLPTPDNTTADSPVAPMRDEEALPDLEVLPDDDVLSDQSDKGDLIMDNLNPETAFYAVPIDDTVLSRISGKSYPEGCPLELESLRYLHVLHYDFNGEIAEGELIVNTAIADTTLSLFKELFEVHYPIEKMVLIDAYDADDERSMEDNNSSAFNYRFIAETEVLSNHALGYAIDINPLYNPYVYTRKDGTTFLQPYNAGDYVDRETGNPYYILKDDTCYNIFISHGFSWGGDWNTKKDYQHFEYPHN